eukprot:6843758-Prymnesium_polylepis.1
MMKGSSLMLPVVTMLAPHGARSACSRAAAGGSPAPRRGAVRATGSNIDGDHGRCNAFPGSVQMLC